MTPSPTTRWLVVPVIAAAILGFAFQGSRGLYDTTEGRYAECARKMIETGNWLVPHIEHKPHWTKPPLTYWAIAGGMKLLGHNEWGIRFYGAFAFVLTTWIVTELALTMWDATTALVAGLIYATAPFVGVGANIVSTDCLLALWTALMLLAYWKARQHTDGHPRRRWVDVLWLAAGLGFITKGPVVLLFLVPIFVFNVWMRRRGNAMPRLTSWTGLLIFAVVGLGWYLWAVLTRQGLLDYFLDVEVVHRVFGEDFERNPEWYKPFIMYLPILAFGTGAWAIFWPWIIARTRRRARATGFFRYVLGNEHGLFLLLALVLPLAVFFIAQSRLLLYMLPLMPAVAPANARGLVRVFERGWLLRICVAVTLVTVGAGVAVKGVLACRPSERDSRRLYDECRQLMRPDTLVLLCNEREFHGLQFYLDGRMRHVTTWTRDKATGLPLLSFLKRLKEAGHAGGCVIIVRKDINDTKDVLREAGYAWRKAKEALEFTFLIVAPQAGSPAFALNR